MEPENWRRDALVAAVELGGGTVCSSQEARALIWAAPEKPELIQSYLSDNHDWVQLPFAGIEPFIDSLDRKRLWTCGKGVYSPAVAEHALAMVLAMKRNLTAYARSTQWDEGVGSNLFGAKVTILGGGGIAEDIIPLLEPFKCEITVIRKRPAPLAGADKTIQLKELRTVLPTTDVLLIALALTNETENLIGANVLKLLPESAVIVNVARGKHIVTEDLVEALRNNEIAGAALDVTYPEPLPVGHPLWNLPNCLITPHTANTPEMGIKLLSSRVTENVSRYRQGLDLIGCIDIDLGY
ncbi:MAG: D-isomer specific 2-hydroxyacid dehydrogenase family protein [Actinomycetota bacterium]|nr:D-isomer specific 2-hydroxyacid dehydrogenase family protein [Actinomycetota bacterium]